MKAVVLAAGESSRLWPLNSRHKSLIKIMGKPLIWYTLEGLRKSKIKEIIIIQSPKRNVKKELDYYKLRLNLRYLTQQRPKGMGNALWQARNLLKDNFFLLNGDVVGSQEIIKVIIEKFKKTKARTILAGQKTKTPELFGMMKLKRNRILGIVEKPKKGKEPSNIKVVGVYFLEPDFFNFYKKVKKHPYDFEDALSLYMKTNETQLAVLKKLEKDTPAFLKYPWHLFLIKKYLFDNFLEAKVSKSAQVAKNVIIQGKVLIGKNTKVYENVVIKGPCYIGDNCLVGNHSLIRQYVDLEKNVMVGTGTEVTRSIFQEDSTCHSGYFGDSIIGRNCKIGAGAITANVRIDRKEIKSIVSGNKINTGLDSFGCVMGENVRTGIRCSFMPGVLIGADCVIGPGSVVTGNIRDNTVFYTKFNEVKRSKKK